MKLILSTLVAGLLLGGAGSYAQSINLGPGGISVDPRSDRERAVEREIRRDERARERARDRRREERAERRRDDCRTVVTREETRRGVVTRETRVCD